MLPIQDERAARDPVYVRQILFAYTNGKLLKVLCSRSMLNDSAGPDMPTPSG